MNIVYKQEIFVEPGEELRNKVEQVLRLVNSGIRGCISDASYIPPTKVTVFLDGDYIAIAHVYANSTLLYSFKLARKDRDSEWVCQSDLAYQFSSALAIMSRM